MKFSDDLRQRLAFMREQTPQHDMTDPGVFIRNLLFVYHVITASENLLQMAWVKQEPLTPLSRYFADHLEEEEGHAAWLARDLLTAGVDVTQLPVNRIAKDMAGSVYYDIFHVSPVALLGYMAYLEMFPTSLDAVERLEEVHGKDLCRTLRYHAEHDIDHGADLAEVLDTLGTEEQRIVLDCAIHTACHYATAVAEFQ